MSVKAIVVLLMALCCLGVSGCSSGPQLAALPADGVILAFGDSLTYGTGATPETSYPAALSRLAGRKVINAGVPGEVTAAGLVRLPDLLEKEKPALVLLCLGGNDFLQRMDDARAEENLRAMVRIIRTQGAAVVLIGVPRLGFGLDVPKWYGKIASDADIPYEGKILGRVLAEKSLKSDLIHPNAAGYQKMAEALAKLLKKAGALP